MKKKKFKPHILLNKEGNCIQIFLEDVASYGEWINGEGADICLYRALDGDDRVVGANLPLKVKKNKIIFLE